MRCLAMGRPMIPNPMNPIFSISMLLFFRLVKIQLLDHIICSLCNESAIGTAGKKTIAQVIIHLILLWIAKQHASSLTVLLSGVSDVPDRLLIQLVIKLSKYSQGSSEVEWTDEKNINTVDPCDCIDIFQCANCFNLDYPKDCFSKIINVRVRIPSKPHCPDRSCCSSYSSWGIVHHFN